MKKGIILFAITSLIGVSCEKQRVTPGTCGCNGSNTELVDNIAGVIVETQDGFEILTDEKGLLSPCGALSPYLMVDNQSVTLSGQLKMPCKTIFGEFAVTPIDITAISKNNTNYNKTDITLTVIRSEDYGYAAGFGFKLEDKRSSHGTTLIQAIRPAVSGNDPFDTPDKAMKSGLLFVYSLRKGKSFITPEVLEYIKVVD